MQRRFYLARGGFVKIFFLIIYLVEQSVAYIGILAAIFGIGGSYGFGKRWSECAAEEMRLVVETLLRDWVGTYESDSVSVDDSFCRCLSREVLRACREKMIVFSFQ